MLSFKGIERSKGFKVASPSLVAKSAFLGPFNGYTFVFSASNKSYFSESSRKPSVVLLRYFVICS